MFKRRDGRAWCTTCLDSDTFAGFVFGAILTLALVLILNLLLPSDLVEPRVLEVARQALYGIPSPP